MKISVVGTGYVGLSLAVLIARKYNVIAIDIVKEKVDLINSRMSPIKDKEITQYLLSNELKLNAYTELSKVTGSDFIIIATPTNYDIITQKFDTSSVDKVVDEIGRLSPKSTIVIKSTVPIGYTKELCKKYSASNIIFSPEFLREGRALYDNLHPSRIIAGIPNDTEELREKASVFLKILMECSLEKDSSKMTIMGSTEAESVKLFSNTYLAMRVAFFNELDTFSFKNNLNTKQIIEGICLDPRIGNYYNNPSFGYGGYCLPKDTKQLLADYSGVPNSLIESIVKSNEIRKRFVVKSIEDKISKDSTIGIYRLIMKSESDNYRESSIIDIMDYLSMDGYNVVVYEPTLDKKTFNGREVITDFSTFISLSEIIIANRMTKELMPHNNKVFCRDVFNRD